ncbi:MAG: tripartite-type tricarboxylate transporter receptor subunit TctC [Alphaproteobacteria bacterium]|jgi:tripartite-type tricarboxylate transporter receptor subunit TctC
MQNVRTGLVLAVAGAFTLGTSAAQAADFYKDKQIKLIIGAAVGGAYDVHGRTVGRHIGNNIPGKPKLTIQNKNGAASQIAAAYVYGIAPQDGTVLTNLLNTLPMRQAIGRTRKSFDITKFQWIGNVTNDVSVVTVWNSSTDIRTIDDLKKKILITGSTTSSALGTAIPRAMNYALGTKFQLVMGYKGGLGVDQALEKGEVAARAGATWSVLRGKYPHWIRDKKITVIAQIGSHRAMGLENVPRLAELAQNDEQRRILAFFSSAIDVGKPAAVGPKVPAVRVAILRKAFNDTMKDPAFLADAHKQGLVISPVRGEDLQKLILSVVNTPAPILKAANKIYGKVKKRGKKTKKKTSN